MIVVFKNIYEETHEPETLGVSNAFTNKFAILVLFLLDDTLPEVAKHSKTL